MNHILCLTGQMVQTRGPACSNIDTQLCPRTFGDPEGRGGGVKGGLVDRPVSRRGPQGVGGYSNIQNDLHDKPIILNIHKWDKKIL